MPNSTTAVDVPSTDELQRAEAFIREPVVLGDEDAAVALGPGTARRRAIDQALAEQSEGLPAPSTAWRRRWSLLLGLERMLSVPEPTLADGTTKLGPHQVDALSGTLTALLAESQHHSAYVPEPISLDDEPGDRRRRGGNGSDEASERRRKGDGAGDQAAAADLAPTARATAGEPAERDDDYDDEGVSGEGSDVPGLTAEELAPTAEEIADLDRIDPADDFVDVTDSEQLEEQAEDPNAAKRFWFEHATGAGKTVAAMGFVDACRLGGVLILTHRRNLVEQFIDEIKTRGYKDRLSPPLLKGEDPVSDRGTLGPVTVETYQWFVRHAGEISSAYTVVICDEAHTALGEKTSGAIREWTGPIFIGMTATGALIARHVADLFPTQTSRFDLAQAARRGVIAPLRCIRIPPGVGVRTIAKVPLRKGDVDMEFDQEMLAEVLDQLPFNLAAADLYKTRFGGMAGVVYAAGVRHAYNLADAFNQVGLKAKAVSGETPKRELSQTLADYEGGKIDVLVNAQLLAEGWNSPRATVCMHLAPTASKRIYQQRVGRVTRREPGKEAGLVIDFVHPATRHDDPVVTLHSLLDRDVYRGGAIVVGPVRRGRGRKIRVEKRVLPVASDVDERIEVFNRELWRIAVDHLDYGEQVQWSALAGSAVTASNWRKARAMLHFDRSGELKRAFLVTALQRNESQQVKFKAVQDIAALRDPEAFADAVDAIMLWPRDARRDAVRVLLQSIADKPVGRRDQATAWIWQLAGATADEHEEYATQRWKDGKRLLGLLVNSAGPAHGRNARRLVQASREQDRRLQAAMLAAARPHTPEATQVVTGARTRLARKPGALARELLRNIPKPGSAPSPKRQDAEQKSSADGASKRGRNAEAQDAGVNGKSADASDAKSVDATAGVNGDTAVEASATVSEPVEYEAWTYESEAAEHAAEAAGNRKRRSRRSRSRRSRKGGAEKSGEQTTAKQNNAKSGGAKQGSSKAKSGDQSDGAKSGGQQPGQTKPGSDPASGDAPVKTRSRRSRGRSRRKPEDPAKVTSAIAEAAAALRGESPAPASAKAEPSAAKAESPAPAETKAASSTAETPAKKPAARKPAVRKPAAKKPAASAAASETAASSKPATTAAATSEAPVTAAKKPAARKPAAAKTTTAAKTTAAASKPAAATKTTAARKPAAAKTATTAAAKTTTVKKPAAAKTTAAAAKKPAAAKTTAAAKKPAAPRKPAAAKKPAAPKAPAGADD